MKNRNRGGALGFAVLGATGLCLLVHAMTTAAQAQSLNLKRGLTTLHHFLGGNGDGNLPAAELLLDADGSLLGTTEFGGNSHLGTVFRLAPPVSPDRKWTKSLLRKFAGTPSDGAVPDAALVAAPDGTLYGVTFLGGPADLGTVFKLKPPAPGDTQWKRTILHSFTGTKQDGNKPQASLLLTEAGALLGTTYLGGNKNSGVVFMLTPSGNTWTFSLVHMFKGGTTDGSLPQSGLTLAPNGVYYGMTTRGGLNDRGVIYSLTPPAPPADWKYRILHNFEGNGSPGTGGVPIGNLYINSKGVLFGTTFNGGGAGSGTVFRLAFEGSPRTWQYADLHEFGTTAEDGYSPQGTLIADAKGTLLGTTKLGGASNHGIIFALSPPGVGEQTWTETILHNFSGDDGAQSEAGLIMDQSGILFGTTSGGGLFSRGTAFAFRR